MKLIDFYFDVALFKCSTAKQGRCLMIQCRNSNISQFQWKSSSDYYFIFSIFSFLLDSFPPPLNCSALLERLFTWIRIAFSSISQFPSPYNHFKIHQHTFAALGNASSSLFSRSWLPLRLLINSHSHHFCTYILTEGLGAGRCFQLSERLGVLQGLD